MSIVVITIPGEQKREFVNQLHKKTKNGVSCVIIQKPKKTSIIQTLLRLSKTVGWAHVPRELWYGLLLRMRPTLQSYLLYVRLRTHKEFSPGYIPKVIEVDSINSKEVRALLLKLKPKLLVIWGTMVLKPEIFSIAKHAINLHMGLGEHYRGAAANQFAIYMNEKDKIGATIHYVHTAVDTGDVLATVTVDSRLPPKEFFTELNDRAEEAFLEIAIQLWKHEKLDSTPQNTERSRNILLREWTPQRRYAVAQKIQAWENEDLSK
jgi:folate-dependent phosphoribosylglycinamide formyltransferase PurN